MEVGCHTILEAKKHALVNGYGAPVMNKPIIKRQRFGSEILEQFEKFICSKENVNMSSYKSDTITGLPVMYLQDHKGYLWERFAEQYPNGMRRTSFMKQLRGGRFVYQDNLGGLCSTCNECGYGVFGDIEVQIAAHESNEDLKV